MSPTTNRRLLEPARIPATLTELVASLRRVWSAIKERLVVPEPVPVRIHVRRR
jgi:hypothetical protein